ncbi:hypothetical protein ILUMI_14578 [Ignelater luminosus]|uniref:Uncharacterized protein n=1 Tax=Ignelater luminosus TaxID=2038154 RepID=A0A8K0CYD1_IGNLU|nr:hypothetical protein ILUMI_14578 [Ignelater luminosus]
MKENQKKKNEGCGVVIDMEISTEDQWKQNEIEAQTSKMVVQGRCAFCPRALDPEVKTQWVGCGKHICPNHRRNIIQIKCRTCPQDKFKYFVYVRLSLRCYLYDDVQSKAACLQSVETVSQVRKQDPEILVIQFTYLGFECFVT